MKIKLLFDTYKQLHKKDPFKEHLEGKDVFQGKRKRCCLNLERLHFLAMVGLLNTHHAWIQTWNILTLDGAVENQNHGYFSFGESNGCTFHGCFSFPWFLELKSNHHSSDSTWSTCISSFQAHHVLSLYSSTILLSSTCLGKTCFTELRFHMWRWNLRACEVNYESMIIVHASASLLATVQNSVLNNWMRNWALFCCRPLSKSNK